MTTDGTQRSSISIISACPISDQIVLCWIVISSKYDLRDAPNLALTQATAERDFCSFEPFSEDFDKGKRAWIEENPEKKSLEFRCSSALGSRSKRLLPAVMKRD